jgi:hypothetical protein
MFGEFVSGFTETLRFHYVCENSSHRDHDELANTARKFSVKTYLHKYNAGERHALSLLKQG